MKPRVGEVVVYKYQHNGQGPTVERAAIILHVTRVDRSLYDVDDERARNVCLRVLAPGQNDFEVTCCPFGEGCGEWSRR